MKRTFTLLFASLFLCVGAWAQVTSLEGFSQEKCYTFATAARGAWAVDAEGTLFSSTGDQGLAEDANDTKQQFAVLSANGADYYLYSVSAKKFVKANRTLVAGPADALAIADASSQGAGRVQFRFRDVENSYINLGGSKQMTVDWWGTIDEGNAVLVSEAGDFNAAEALAMLSKTMWVVTYEFTYGEEVKFTQTTKVVAGEAYPDYSVVLPYGVTVGAKPEGTVSADEVVKIPLTLTGDLPFTVSTLTDGKFGEGMSWYYLTMRGKDVTYDAATGKAVTGNVEEKSAYNYFAFTGNPFDGYSIYNYVAGPNKVFWREDATDGGRVFFTAKEETDGNTWMLSANGENGYVFRLNGYDTGYMNDHKPDIAIWNSSWGATDAGSTCQFVFVENPELIDLYDVTYEYVYNDEVKATQTTTVEGGAEYPACSFFAPYGVTVGAKPEGTVSASGTHKIELTVEHELPFKTAADVNSIDTWYYVQMHANSSVTAYVEDTEADSVEWKDPFVADNEIDSHLWGYAGDVWTGIKMVNKSGRAIVSTSGKAVLGDAANATAFIPTYSNGAFSEWFCLRYPDNSDYLNANAGKIASWWDDDNGSSFFLTEYNKEYSIEVLAEVGYATYYSQYKLAIPETVKAYVVSEITKDGSAMLEQVTGVLPANTGVILAGEGSHKLVTSAAEPAKIGSNLLRGTIADAYVEGSAYVLSNGSTGVGLYKAELNKDKDGAEGTTHFKNDANNAYLVLPEGVLEGEPYMISLSLKSTGIETITTNAETVIYDLAGRRVAKMEKGIYIVNGKKVVIK